MKRALVAFGLCLLPTMAAAKPSRVVLSVGANEGSAGEKPLRYAERDAKRFAAVMREQGWVDADQILLLQNPTSVELRAALAKAAEKTARSAESETSFYFYFSGHGDREALHLRDGVFSTGDLARAVGQTKATFKLVVTDACRTERSKGAHAEPGFAVHLAPPPEARGVMWVHASADGEVAQESDALEGAVFSSYFLSAMRGLGDRDHDHRVSLDEAFSFAFHHARVHAIRSDQAAQHPGFDANLRDAGQIILTYTDASSGRLQLPAARDTQFFVYEKGSEAIYAELWGDDRPQTISLPPGRYMVHRKGILESAAVEVQIARNQQRELSPSEFFTVPRERLAQKGGLELFRHEAGLQLSPSYNALVGTMGSLGLYLQRLEGRWTYGLQLSAGYGERDSGAFHFQNRVLGAVAVGRYAFTHAGPWSVHAHGALGGGAIWQDYQRLDAAELAGTPYQTSFSASSMYALGEVGAELRADWTPRWSSQLLLLGDARLTSHDDGLRLWPGVRAQLGVGYRFR